MAMPKPTPRPIFNSLWSSGGFEGDACDVREVALRVALDDVVATVAGADDACGMTEGVLCVALDETIADVAEPDDDDGVMGIVPCGALDETIADVAEADADEGTTVDNPVPFKPSERQSPSTRLISTGFATKHNIIPTHQDHNTSHWPPHLVHTSQSSHP